MKWSLLPLLAACGAAFAGDIQPYHAKEVKPYQAQQIKPYQAQQVKPSQAGDIKPYQAHEAKRYTQEDFDRMNRQTDEEARRIAKQRGGSAPNAQQLYWQQQIQHRQMEATNPDITYHGR